MLIEHLFWTIILSFIFYQNICLSFTRYLNIYLKFNLLFEHLSE